MAALSDGAFAVGPLLLGSLVARRQVVRKFAATSLSTQNLKGT